MDSYPPEPVCATWSIAARDAASGRFGIAVASCHIAVGAYVPNIRPGVAAVCTQSWANAALAPRIWAAVATGDAPGDAVAAALETDDRPGNRQIAVIDYLGRTTAYTGVETQAHEPSQWWGHAAGDDYVVAGNTLTGPAVVQSTADRFMALRAAGERFEWALVLALAAGDAAGGDHRGRQAAALLVSSAGPEASEYTPQADLRVDDHPAPIVELQRLCGLHLPPRLVTADSDAGA